MNERSEKKVSVIIPIYNAENNLRRCVESVLDQTYKNLEVILINDGSQDGSGKICNELADDNKRAKAYHQKNCGVSAARNLGIEKSTGEYIYFMDADDYVDKTAMVDAIEVLEGQSVDWVSFGFYSEVIMKNRAISDEMSYPETNMQSKDGIRKHLVGLWDKHILYNIWNKVYKREIIEKYQIRFPQLTHGEDMEFNKEYLSHISKMYIINKCYYHYVRCDDSSATESYNDKLFERRLKEYAEFQKHFAAWGVPESEYTEFLSRWYVERLLGSIENLFRKNDLSYVEKRNLVKSMVINLITQSSLSQSEFLGKKVKILLFPVKHNLYTLTLIEISAIHFVKQYFPTLFNRQKNNR